MKALVVAAVLLGGASAARAGAGAGVGVGVEADLLPKKEARIAVRDGAMAPSDADRVTADKKKKAWQAELQKRIGKPPPALINFYNTWTHEYVVVDALKGTLAPELVDRMLRCHFTNEPAQMDQRLIPSVLKAARKFGSNRVDIVSGYRAPKYNLMIRKKGHEVARDSQHTHGNAIDFRLRGVGVHALHDWAVALRLGGVGLYEQNEFVHIDTARIRYWGGE